MTPFFTGKLDELDGTIRLLLDYDPSDLANALAAGRGRQAIAVGSGGSAVAAAFLARCRDTLGLGSTVVETPMGLSLGAHDLLRTDIWLFSAGADNADVVAAARSAVQRGCRSIRIVTRGPTGRAAGVVSNADGEVHVVPVASEKDGYLATHSMIATVGALLLASDAVAHDARGHSELIDAMLARLANRRGAAARSAIAERFASLGSRDAIILLSDPQMRTVSTLLETSIWEASICPVQAVDFRNFAHGRHGWLHHRADETLVLAITGLETRDVWSPIRDAFPASIRQVTVDLGDGGRLSNALSVIDGLGMVEAMGQSVGIDPAKPGYGTFGPTIYDDRSLEALVDGMPASVRHKRTAMARTDERNSAPDPLLALARARLDRLAAVAIAGLVFDYDGTLVSTQDRYDPPRSEIVDELIRLDAAGVRIAVATGRGGSAGSDLRKALPSGMHGRVLVGYYNGGHVVPLDIDIDIEKPTADPTVAETADWLRMREELFVASNYKVGRRQITIGSELLVRPYRFRRDMAECPLVRDGRVRVTGSGHSFDVVPTSASKLRVVEAVRQVAGRAGEILCFGDSGSSTGNDHDLLAHPFGISVGEVCGAPDGCWSLFGDHPTGPDALLKALRALVGSPEGEEIRLDVAQLPLDTIIEKST